MPARGVAPLRILALACLGSLLTACAAPRPAAPPVAAPAPEVVEVTPLERAQNLLIEAEYTPEPEPSRHAIDAVLALPEPAPGLLLRAERLWSLLPDEGLGNLADRYRGARLAMLVDEPGLAYERLPPVDDDWDRSLYFDALALHAELLTGRSEWGEALRARITLDQGLFIAPRQQSDNQTAIWSLLAAQPPGQLQRLEQLSDDEALRGWSALFLGLREAGGDPDGFAQAVRNWDQAYPRHPAQALLPELRNATLRPTEPPRRIAVLLPLSGSLGDLGNAILEGIAAQFYRDHGATGSLLIFDTAGQPDLADAHYRNALQQGADRVIGPLTRESVERVAAIDSRVPTLVLNRPSTPLPPPFAALSLSPEDDAQAAAGEALRSGRDRALVLVPEGPFGERVAGAFRDAFELQDGRVTAEHRFQARSPDINAQIGSALGIDASEARIRRVARQSGLTLDADAQIRADIDVIFVAGPARDLRMVVPHLHYHRGGRLPMLATSHAYEGRPQPMLDSDLSGIRFPDAPWLYTELNPEPALRAELTGPEADDTVAHRLPRFAALGVDAVRVAADLPRYQRAPHLPVHGVAGNWALQPFTRTWIRDPAWVEFHEGLPRPARPDRVIGPAE
ncbi:MAG: penicillin-binding protein activator [Thioalkalivibrio sp.]|nr:MAG: penicillin-binding protein activator [Thioalkalivibrio sp.]